MVAIFKMSCCGREVIFGRTRGDDMYPPTVAKCYYGCVPKKSLNGRPGRIPLVFVRMGIEQNQPEQLLKTWKWRPRDPDPWHRRNREWLKNKEAAGQGKAPQAKRGKK